MEVLYGLWFSHISALKLKFCLSVKSQLRLGSKYDIHMTQPDPKLMKLIISRT